MPYSPGVTRRQAPAERPPSSIWSRMMRANGDTTLPGRSDGGPDVRRSASRPARARPVKPPSRQQLDRAFRDARQRLAQRGTRR